MKLDKLSDNLKLVYPNSFQYLLPIYYSPKDMVQDENTDLK
jgi:hypothetical protein